MTITNATSEHAGKSVRILVVDDAPETLEILRRNLSAEGYRVVTAPSVGEAVEVLESTAIDVVVTDYKMPKVGGLTLVRHVRENHPDVGVMMITGYATVGGAVEAMKTGAEEYLPKPFTDEELLAAVRRTLDGLQLRRIGRQPEGDLPMARFGLLGRSKPMLELFRSITKASNVTATVLVLGETGTGKELVARAIHYGSSRSQAPFVAVNCGGIPEGLVERELFGHVKGAFTGAMESRDGFFQAAGGGTIFLDEVSETSAAMQVRLLRVLQEREVCRIGETRPRQLDVRVMTASNKALRGLVDKGGFREDLYYRLNVVEISVPPLRERGDGDVIELVRYFADLFAREVGIPNLRFTDRALTALCNHDWPGNVRELENTIQRLAVMTGEDVIDASDLPASMRFSAPRSSGAGRSLAEVELQHIQAVLAHVGGNKSEAARILGIDRKTLREKLRAVSPETT